MPLSELKELLKSRDTENINAFIQNHPTCLDEVDENEISGLMYLSYHQLPDSLAFAMSIKKDFTLHEAAATGLLHRVISKINVQPNALNLRAKDGFAPLTLACYFGQLPVVKYLIRKGAAINIPARNPSKVMPLHSAVAKNDIAICQFLLENGAKVNATQIQGVTALHSAAHRGNFDLVKLLVKHGADIHATTEDGKTALSFAEADGHTTVEAYLKSL